MAASVFVAGRRGHGVRRSPQRGRVEARLRRDLGQDRVRNADVGKRERAAAHPARQQHMARLEPEEGDRIGRLNGNATDETARAIDARWNVDGQERTARRFGPCVGAFDQRLGVAIDVPRQARTEQRVDDDVGVREIDRVRPCHRAGPQHRGPGGIVAQGLTGDERGDRDVATSIRKQSCGDVAITAVVAGPAQDLHASLRPGDTDRRRRDRLAGALHQRGRWHAGGRQRVRARHLGRIEEGDWEAGLPGRLR